MRPILLSEKTISNLIESDDTDFNVEPVIEIATYSEVEVYECYFKGSETKAVMRRVANDWVNATQVFKIANFNKNKRTKILEKESKFMKHEKIQGGYGRFQGTWIPLNDAKMLVNKYEIQNKVVNTILNYIVDLNNLPPKRSKSNILKKNLLTRNVISPSSYKVTPKKRNFSSTSDLVDTTSTISMSHSISNGSNKKVDFHTPTQIATKTKSSQNYLLTDSNKIANEKISSLSSFLMSPGLPKPLELRSFEKRLFMTPMQNINDNRNVSTSSLELITTPQDSFKEPTFSATPVDDDTKLLKENISPLQLQEYKDLIIKVLSSEDCLRDGYDLPMELYTPPNDLDINYEVDSQGHTILHWAAAMGNLALIRLLISLKCSILCCNKSGFNAVTKMIFYNNSYNAGNFQEAISLLQVCLYSPDKNGRLPVHYLVELTANKAKDQNVINYYLDMIIANLKNGDDDEKISMVEMVLDYPDHEGNTVLHLAALNANRSLYDKLIKLGCSDKLANFNNNTPAALLQQNNLLPTLELPEFLSLSFAIKEANMNMHNEDQGSIPDTLLFKTPILEKGFSELQKFGYDDLQCANKEISCDNTSNNPIKENEHLPSSIKKNSSNTSVNNQEAFLEISRPHFVRDISLLCSSPSIDNEDEIQKSYDYIYETSNSTLKRNTQNLLKLTQQFSNKVFNKVDVVDNEIRIIKKLIATVDQKIDNTNNSINKIRKHFSDSNSELLSINQIRINNKNLKQKLDFTKDDLIKVLTLKNKLPLSNFYSEEELKLKNKPISESRLSPEKLIDQYQKLHEQNQKLLKSIVDAYATITISDRLNKYKKLVSTNSNNFSLSDIEKELATTLTTTN